MGFTSKTSRSPRACFLSQRGHSLQQQHSMLHLLADLLFPIFSFTTLPINEIMLDLWSRTMVTNLLKLYKLTDIKLLVYIQMFFSSVLTIKQSNNKAIYANPSKEFSRMFMDPLMTVQLRKRSILWAFINWLPGRPSHSTITEHSTQHNTHNTFHYTKRWKWKKKQKHNR